MPYVIDPSGHYKYYSSEDEARHEAATMGWVYAANEADLQGYLQYYGLNGPPPAIPPSGFGSPGPSQYPTQPQSSGGGTMPSDITNWFGDTGGTGGGTTSGSGGTPWYQTEWGKTLLNLGLGLAGAKLLGGETGAEKALSDYATAGFGSGKIQAFLPLALQKQFTEPILGGGISGIGNLIMRPGGLSPSVADAVNPRLATESMRVAQNYRNLRSENAGAAGRTNAPLSLKNAINAALGIGESRDQGTLRREAYAESEGLRREDLGQTYKLLDALLQFTSSGRGQAVAGLGGASQQSGQRQASQLALLGSLLSGSAA